MALLVFPSALSAEKLWNGNTSLTATAAGNAWIGVSSPKQRLSCLRNNSPGYIFSHPASALYPLAAFGMTFSLPQFFFISLLTFYLQTFVSWFSLPNASLRPFQPACFFYSISTILGQICEIHCAQFGIMTKKPRDFFIFWKNPELILTQICFLTDEFAS